MGKWQKKKNNVSPGSNSSNRLITLTSERICLKQYPVTKQI